MIDIDLLDEQLDGALTAELRAQLKPLVRPPAPTPAPPATPRRAPRPPAVEPSRFSSFPARTEWAAAEPVGPEPPRTVPKPVAAAAPPPAAAAPPPAAPARRVIVEPARRRPPLAGPPAGSRWTAPSAMPPPFEADLEATAPARRRRPVLKSRLRLPDETPEPAPPPPTPAPAHRPAPARRRAARAAAIATPAVDVEPQTGAQEILDALARGQRAVADRLFASHAPAEAQGTLDDRRDAARWATMRATLDGRQADARASSARTLSLGQQAADPDSSNRYWLQHAWIVLEWGSDKERDELLDHCRQRAYRRDEPGWRSTLALVLARLGRMEEAQREFDATADRLPPLQQGSEWLDITTNLAETAAYLGDARRASQLNRAVAWPATGMVVTGEGGVCKGSIARYRALLAATTGRWAEADTEFRTAVEAHRRMGAELLLARTLQEWGRSLVGRDDARARNYLDESAELARQLELAERFTTS